MLVFPLTQCLGAASEFHSAGVGAGSGTISGCASGSAENCPLFSRFCTSCWTLGTTRIKASKQQWALAESNPPTLWVMGRVDDPSFEYFLTSFCYTDKPTPSLHQAEKPASRFCLRAWTSSMAKQRRTNNDGGSEFGPECMLFMKKTIEIVKHFHKHVQTCNRKNKCLKYVSVQKAIKHSKFSYELLGTL